MKDSKKVPTIALFLVFIINGEKDLIAFSTEAKRKAFVKDCIEKEIAVKSVNRAIAQKLMELDKQDFAEYLELLTFYIDEKEVTLA